MGIKKCDVYNMNYKNETIREWENVEVERSASEAQKKGDKDLKIDGATIQRYLEPPENTFYPLEYAYHLLGDVSGKTVLDYGCGAGENSVLVAKHGGDVIGVDISPELLEIAGQRMDLHGFDDKYDFRVGSAHDLPLEDESVDVVFGMAILHHLDLDLSSKEVFRVLKKGGRAIFFEPVRNSKAIKFIRNLIPYQEPDISPFERPLTDAELKDFSKQFTNYKSRAFSLPFVNLVQVLGLSDKLLHKAISFDGKVLRSIPQLDYIATIRVFEITKS